MIKYIEESKVIEPVVDKNWEIIPQDWWQKAYNKEYKMIFN